MKKFFFSFFIMILFTVLGMIFILTPFMDKLTKNYVNEYYRELVKGPIFVILKDLEGLSSDKKQDYIESLKPSFGFPLAIKHYKDMEFAGADLKKLLTDEIVVKENATLYHKKIEETELVLTLGPFPEMKSLHLDVIAYTSLAILMALSSLIWAITYWRNVKKISKAASAFGNGMLDTRAEVPKWSSLSSLASAFNSMAGRIQQLIKSHKELTNAVSHELRTPITRIRFGMEMVESSQDAPDRERYLSGIRHDVDELDSLVTDMLTHARFDRESPRLELAKHKILPWFNDIVKCSQSENSTLTYTFKVNIDDNFLVKFEPFFMGRALKNLLQNAARHTQKEIKVTLGMLNNECVIHVDDNGPGVLPDERMRIFEPFVRLDSSRNRKSGGYGLGLAIVRRIAEWHGGSAEVTESSLGGARFTIQWPGCV